MSNPVGQLSNDEILAEVARRGLLTELHGAVGALYDNLVETGVLDGDSQTTQYLAYRLRREDSKIGGAAGQSSVDFWKGKIGEIDAEQGAHGVTPYAVPRR